MTGITYSEPHIAHDLLPCSTVAVSMPLFLQQPTYVLPIERHTTIMLAFIEPDVNTYG